ncbi:MAG TPA: family 20 glycosylhydrolase [bacterium]|nr:family 20 glycosylhydrolase [bacterium]
MRKSAILYLCLAVFLPALLAAAEPLALMPVPEKMTMAEGQYRFDASFTLAVEGRAHPRLYSGATRMLRRLSGRTGLFMTQDVITPQTRAEKPGLIIRCQRPGKVALGEDESYELAISPAGVELRCVTDLGGLHGLETLLQLLQADEKGFFFPALSIQDKPRFPWRGLMIDVCRHWLPMEVVKRNLDGMAAVKMNVLHLHLSEDQGFRIESKLYPKLHQLGSDGFYYTQAEIKTIIAYADERGIRVYPEFDMPGHTTTWFIGHPELASAPGPYSIERRWGVFDPTMDPTKESTYKLLDRFIGEMAALFPDPFFHIGGDENNGKQWNANPAIQAFMKKNNIKDNHSLQAYFNSRLLKIVTKHGKRMVGWDEILHPQMPKNIVIQSWRGPQFLVRSARQGYQGILSNGYYIDLVQPASFHYLNDPVPADSALTPAESALILGGEATSWAELVTPETVDSRIWPRTAVIAERLWSPASVRDLDDMYRRMEVISRQLEELNLTHIRNYEMMLRRLANQQETSALRVFTDVVEPLKLYKRHSQGVTYYSYSPYTRVVDAARPESMTARSFARKVEAFLTAPSGPEGGEILNQLALWQENHARLLQTMAKAPAIREMESLSRDLADLAAAGLQAAEAIQEGRKLGGEWGAVQKEAIERAKKPRGQTELMVVEPIARLIQAAQ